MAQIGIVRPDMRFGAILFTISTEKLDLLSGRIVGVIRPNMPFGEIFVHDFQKKV